MTKDLSRRQFLHRTAGAAGALAASPAIFLEPEHIPLPMQTMAPSDRLRFGIIGIGMQGSGLLHDAIQLPGVECIAACDLYDGRHTLAQEIVGKKIPTTRRYKDLLDNKEIDCLIAAVPDHWHKQVVVDAVSAGKDIYCEKPMSHSAADGVAMVAAAKKTGRVVQIGSQRVSSVICAKAKELLANGIVGTLTLVEGSLGRNDPTGAWVYPPPPDLSLANFDWDTWQGDATKRPWEPDMSPKYFARWRCWKEYGTGLAGDLLVHLVSGMNFMLGWNEPPKRAMALGDILRFKDGRNMPDVHATLFDYGRAPIYLRLNLGCETPEIYRFQGSKGILEVTEYAITYFPQSGEDDSPCLIMCRGAACCAPLGKLVAKIFLDFSRFHTILNGVDNYVWSAGACSRFSFSRPPFPPCRPRPTKIAPFRINQLGYAFFGTPLFCYSCIFMSGVPPTEEKMNTNSHSSTLLPLVRTGAEPGRCNHRFPNGK